MIILNKMLIIKIVVLLQLSLVNGINITAPTSKIKSILTNYKSNRYTRCFDKIHRFVPKTLNFVQKNDGLDEFLKGFNVSQSYVDKAAEYVKSQILDGLIIHDDLPEWHWHEYKSVHDKAYATPHQELEALSKWRNNLRIVAQHNRDFLLGKQSYSLHLNLFGDLYWVDYKGKIKRKCATIRASHTRTGGGPSVIPELTDIEKKFLSILGEDLGSGLPGIQVAVDSGSTHDVKEYFNKFLKLFHTFPLFDPAEDHHKTAYRKSLHSSVPETVDWRTKGFKPRLEEQHDCGACYAFAVTHALQAQLYKRHGYWGELSPQQIVDCSFKDGNAGCDGGSLRGALRYAARDGLVKESQYPYVGKKGSCKYNSLSARVRARRWATLPAGDEGAMERSLATTGPLAVAVNAAPFTFQLYRSGIYDDLFCTPWQMNHAMLLVGYTPQYWILLNWWGKNWGEDGYIRIRRGLNRCGVTNMATYVEL